MRNKVVAAIKDFKNLSHPICYSEAANQVIGKYKAMVCLITSFEEMAFQTWVQSVEALTTENLEEPLLIRKEGILSVNFGKHLLATLLEVKHLRKDFSHREVPENASKIFLRYDKFRKSKNILDQIVNRWSPCPVLSVTLHLAAITT